MKILIVNYRYFISGGPERYMFNIKALLEKNGHEVIPFSTRSDRNEPSEYDRYFVEPIGGRSNVYYEDYKKTPRNLWKMFSRSVYSLEVKKALMKQIRDVNPDVVYVLQCINKLSPSVIRAAKQMGVPVVNRLSDYQLMCPKFDFLRENAVCEDCVKHGLGCAVRNRCVKGSLAASMVRVFAMRFQRFIHVYDDVDMFITPSAFLRTKLIENGYDPDRIVNIPTFTVKEGEAGITAGTYGLYVGRIAELKDLPCVIRAYEMLPDHELKIVGDDTGEEAEDLKKYIRDHGMDNVTFEGFKSGAELEDLYRGSRFGILSSISYDNLPNSALESMIFNKPLIASDVGSLKELVDDGINGYRYRPGDARELADRIRQLDSDETVLRMAGECRVMMKERFSADAHYSRLMSVFENLVKNRTR